MKRMTRTSASAILPMMAAMLVGGGCASTGRTGGANTSHAEIPQLLQRQAAAWNRGDINGFMDGYWRSPLLTFSSTGKITRGWQPMFDRFRGSYPDKSIMGTLTFSDLEVTDLGTDSALVLGRWRIVGKEPDAGAFSLVMRRLDNRWVIIHDHTSRDEADKSH